MSEIITIDGPTSSGKTSVGQALANQLKFQFIDSGAIYRAGARKILDDFIDVTNQQAVADVFQKLSVNFKSKKGETKVYLDGQDITRNLHDLSITKIVPIIAAYPKVRQIANQIQYRLAQSKNIVMVGRDIGSQIFPDAKHKFYLDAKPEIRAKRRFDQLQIHNRAVKFQKVYEEMLERDRQDSTREISPMRIPKGAIVIDTSNQSVEDTINQIRNHLLK